MNQKFQFSITMVLGLTSIVALVLTRHSFWATVATSEIVIVVLAAESLVRNLPTSIQRVMDANCLDRKGDFSPRRVRKERTSLRELWWGIVRICLLILIPTNLMIWLFLAGGGEWIVEWAALSSDNAEEAVGEGTTAEQIQILTTVYLVATVVWTLGAFMVFKSAYLTLLKQFNGEVTRRSSRRKMRDWEANELDGGGGWKGNLPV